MLRVLLAKDLRRVWRNPLPALINIALPICLTALIGMAFGGKSNGELEKVHFAIVDEDQQFLAQLLRGAINQPQSSNRLDAIFVDRDEALRQINDNKISAALIIPTNFTKDYFLGRDTKLELIKNPQQSIQPAALEELSGIVVALLNGVARNLKAQFPDWRGAFEGDVDHHRIAEIVEIVGDRIETVKKYVNPPLVGYQKNEDQSAAIKRTTRGTQGAAENEATTALAGVQSRGMETKGDRSQSANSDPKPISWLSKVFAWILLGMTAMFLLFLANNAMTDLHHEMRFRTLERYQTLREQLFPFIVGKVVFAVVFLLICAAVILGGGGLIFHVEWQHPLAIASLALGYACCCAGIMAVLVALMPDERRATTLNSVLVMLMSFAGGCMFPSRQLPALVQNYITPLMPSFWFVDAARGISEGDVIPWGLVTLKLLITSAVFIAIAVVVFQQKFKRGLRA